MAKNLELCRVEKQKKGDSSMFRRITPCARHYQVLQKIAMTMRAEIAAGQLAELVEQVQAGNEVLLTKGNKLVAKIVPAPDKDLIPHVALQIHSRKGPRVLTPIISQSELADEMFNQQ
jgi:antitoxin (DNA-binding transcriptional repressor) of toxin-antitoxin stability system